MKNPNGYGSITKLKGKLRRPWMVRITTGRVTDYELQKTKQVRKVLGYYASRADAMQALADYNNNPFDLNLSHVTFSEVYHKVLPTFSKNRLLNYKSAFKYLAPIHDKPIRSIKAAQMQACIDSCATTQQREIKTVCRKVFFYALQQEIVDKNPAQYLKCNTVDATIERSVFTPDQIRDLFTRSDLWAKLTLMLLYSGMRTKELFDLEPENINIDEKYVKIVHAKNKSSVRMVPIHEKVIPLFTDYKNNKQILTHNGLNKQLKKYCGHLAHDCRHTFTSKMRACGCDLLVLQIILGHTPQTITERIYTHIDFKELLNAVNMLVYF